MADWCKHFELGSGWFSSDYCNISGKRETMPSSYQYYCKNGGYKCPWYEKEEGTSGGCFITTITCNILLLKFLLLYNCVFMILFFVLFCYEYFFCYDILVIV